MTAIMRIPHLWIVNWRRHVNLPVLFARVGMATTLLLATLLLFTYRTDVESFSRRLGTASERIGGLQERVHQLEACIADPGCVEVPPPPPPTTTTTTTAPKPRARTKPTPATRRDTTSSPTRRPSSTTPRTTTTTTNSVCPGGTLPVAGAECPPL